MAQKQRQKSRDTGRGRLRIGNQWNAIRIIALSQTNPLKAIAEFVENSIDAGAKNVSIIRGKSRGEQYLKVVDDGSGISDFHYVATHIGDSIKRRLKEQGAEGIQGEFGIGMLSFWTVGEELTLTSCAPEGEPQRLHLVKDSPDFTIRPSRELFERPGTALHVQPLLPGVKSLSGEKIQSYLASELRDRISRSGVRIRIVDRSARKDLLVEPRRFHGQLLHGLPEPRTPLGEVYVECYLTEPGSGAGVVYDDAFDSLVDALEPVERALNEAIEEHRRAEEEEASKAMLRRITRALKEAGGGEQQSDAVSGVPVADGSSEQQRQQREFFEFPGSLYRLDIRPATARVAVSRPCRLRAVPRDKSRRTLDADVDINWVVEQGSGTLDTDRGEYAVYTAPEEPELAVVRAHAVQDEVECEARATITVTAELGGTRASGTGAVGRHGLPGYTYRYAPGELWRSRYDPDEALITVNSGHADFVYASRQQSTKLRYVGRLFAKEIVLANFPGADRNELLERMIELELYMDRSLR